MTHSPRLALLTGLASLASATQGWATEESLAGTRYASLGTEADDDHSRVVTGALGLPVGGHGRLDFGLGRSRVLTLDAASVDSTFASVDAGIDMDRWETQIGYAYRKDSDSFHQHDLTGTVSYVMDNSKLGLDLFYRSAEDETTTSVQRRRRDPRSVRTVESIDGRGIGLHGDIDVSDSVRLSVSGMVYDYDRDLDAPAFLARFPRLGLRLSGVTRDEAFLDNTARASIDYSFDLVTLTATYIRDEELDTHDITGTGELSADLPLGERWLLTASAGYSSSEAQDGVAFAGLAVSVMW